MITIQRCLIALLVAGLTATGLTFFALAGPDFAPATAQRIVDGSQTRQQVGAEVSSQLVAGAAPVLDAETQVVLDSLIRAAVADPAADDLLFAFAEAEVQAHRDGAAVPVLVSLGDVVSTADADLDDVLNGVPPVLVEPTGTAPSLLYLLVVLGVVGLLLGIWVIVEWRDRRSASALLASVGSGLLLGSGLLSGLVVLLALRPPSVTMAAAAEVLRIASLPSMFIALCGGSALVLAWVWSRPGARQLATPVQPQPPILRVVPAPHPQVPHPGAPADPCDPNATVRRRFPIT